MPEAGLLARGLTREFATRGEPLRVLRGIDLALAPGESAAVMGPSGSGKSTLLHILGALDPPTAGEVRVAGRNPFALPEAELAAFRNATVGFVFQAHHLLPQCSALENVLLPTLAQRSARRPADDRSRAAELLRRVGLGERMDHRPAELSGGERQRVAIARALINRPALLLADEPTGNLDPEAAEQVADLFVELHRSEGMMLLVVTHSDSLARRFGRTYRLLRGRLQPAATGEHPPQDAADPAAVPNALADARTRPPPR